VSAISTTFAVPEIVTTGLPQLGTVKAIGTSALSQHSPKHVT
jgi:hypothetical protein